jgi:hypothetical protein
MIALKKSRPRNLCFIRLDDDDLIDAPQSFLELDCFFLSLSHSKRISVGIYIP